MFVYKYHKEKDIYGDEHSYYAVGFILTEWNEEFRTNVSTFETVRTFSDRLQAERYVHYLNGGNKIDELRTAD